MAGGREKGKKGDQAGQGQGRSSSIPSSSSAILPESGNDSPPETPVSEELDQPIVSPRDANHYRIIQLKNGFKAILVSTCGHGTEKAIEELANEDANERVCQNPPDTSVFNRRRRVIREQNPGEVETSKSRSRVGKTNSVPSCVDTEEIERFDQDQSSRRNREGGSIMDEMLGGAGSSEPTPGTDDVEMNGNPSQPTWLPEEPEEKILQRSCGIMKAKSPQVEFAINAAAGSIFDPPGMPGRAVLSRELLARTICKSGSGISYVAHPYTHAEHATIKFRTKTEDLEKKLAYVGEQLTKIVLPSKKNMLQEIDQLDKDDEFFQCRVCWWNPLTDWRRYTVLVSLAKEEHPIRNISPGDPTKLWELNKEDLDNLETSIYRFVQEKYVGDNMTFAIRAPEPLDMLDQWVTAAFGGLPAGNVPEILGEDEPFDTDEFRKFYTVHCSNMHCCDQGDSYIIITFPLPPEIGLDYKVKPLDYYNELLTYGGHGGLCAYLREQNLAVDIQTNCNGCEGSGVQSNAYVTLFEIQLTLAEEGMQRSDQAIAAVFAYLKFLRTSGPFPEFYDEIKKMRSVNFHALEREVSFKDPFPTHVARLSQWLRYYSPKEVMVAPFLVLSFDDAVINSLAEKLVPEKANYMLCVCPNDNEHKSDGGAKLEPIFQTKYHANDISEDQLSMWQTVQIPAGQFTAPQANPFLPDFDLPFCMIAVESNEVKLFRNTKSAKVWYQQDDSSGHFVVYFVHLLSSTSFSRPENSILLRLWCLILQDQMIPLTHAANKASMGFNIQPTRYGLMISLYSWNHKIEAVLEVILTSISDFGIIPVEAAFHRMKKALLKDMTADVTHEYWSSTFLANDVFQAISQIDGWTCLELEEELRTADYADLVDFTSEFKRTCNCAAVLRGNVVEENAGRLSELIETCFSPVGRSVAQISSFKRRLQLFPSGEHVVKFQTFGLDCNENTVFNYYQIEKGLDSRVFSEILIDILSPHIVTKSKEIQEKNGKKEKPKGKSTAQKTGGNKWFEMYGHTREIQGIVTLCIESIGSIPAFDVVTMDTIIANTLRSFNDVICKLSLKEFNAIKGRLKKGYKAGNLEGSILGSDLYDLYDRLADLTFRWTDNDCKADALDPLTLENFQHWYRKNFIPESIGFRKLSVRVLGNPPTKEKPIVPEETREEWRERRSSVRDCAFNINHRLLHHHKPPNPPRDNLNLTFLSDTKGTGGASDCDDPLYILDIPTFKSRMFKQPVTLDRI